MCMECVCFQVIAHFFCCTPLRIVEVIPHGVPVLSHDIGDPYKSKSLFGTDRKIIYTNGLLHQGKGLEYAIEVGVCDYGIYIVVLTLIAMY